MKKFCIVGATLAATLGADLLTSFAAIAADGNTAEGTSLYAGPSEQYPEVTHLAGGLTVTIHGCLRNWQWCDVSWRGDRGWMQASALAYRSGDQRLRLRPTAPPAGVPVLGFDLAKYWDANYQQRLWYDNRTKWELQDLSSRQ